MNTPAVSGSMQTWLGLDCVPPPLTSVHQTFWLFSDGIRVSWSSHEPSSVLGETTVGQYCTEPVSGV